MSQRIPLSVPQLGGNAERYLHECVETNFVSSVGPFVDRFEGEFAAFVGAKHAVACASGTAAIHVALRLLGVGRGDEVLVPTFTFIASANPILYEGATPVFVDSERRSWNLDPERVVAELERRARAGLRQPKAVEVVHLLGHPAEIEPIRAACEKHGVTMFEDAAEALGATFSGGRLDGKHVGTVGRLGCFSFNGNKVMTTGGGGMIVTDDAELARRAKHLTTQARLPGLAYRHDEVGYNYRLTNLAAALGVAQLEQLPSFLARKREIAARYDAAFADLRAIERPPRAPWAAPSMWLYSVLVSTGDGGVARDRLLDRLVAAGIEARPLWTPLHTMPMYRDAARLGDGSVADAIAGHGLSIPCSVGLSSAEQDAVIAAVRGAVS